MGWACKKKKKEKNREREEQKSSELRRISFKISGQGGKKVERTAEIAE